MQIFISEKCKKSLITLWLESKQRPDLSDPLGASQSGSPSFLNKVIQGIFLAYFILFTHLRNRRRIAVIYEQLWPRLQARSQRTTEPMIAV